MTSGLTCLLVLGLLVVGVVVWQVATTVFQRARLEGLLQDAGGRCETFEGRFVHDARRYHGLEGKATAPVTLDEERPVFQTLSAAQRNWYFYWRTCARSGMFLHTSPGYLFLYVFELLCLIEMPDPLQAAQQIRLVWSACRASYPQLDAYLPEWGGDLLAARAGVAQCLDWWWEMITVERIQAPAAVVNRIVQDAVAAGRVDALPYPVWAALNPYRPQNKFFQRYNPNGDIERGYLRAILAVDGYLSTLRARRGLLERYTSPRQSEQRKMAFQGAVVPADFPRLLELGQARQYVDAPRLGALLSAICRYSENILRRQRRFAARLAGVELEARFQAVLDAAFADAAPQGAPSTPAGEGGPLKISLDAGRIAQLHQESERVRALLAPEDGEVEPVVRLRPLPAENRRPARIVEAGRDAIEWGTRQTPASGPPAPDDGHAAWQKFCKELTPLEAQVIALLLGAEAVTQGRIDELARSQGTMGSLLMDGLNEKAIECLERTPFYVEAEVWYVEEEDRDVLRERTRPGGC